MKIESQAAYPLESTWQKHGNTEQIDHKTTKRVLQIPNASHGNDNKWAFKWTSLAYSCPLQQY